MAGEHVREEGQVHPVETQDMAGTITLFEGLSL
jgi:hypothetical protein